MSQQLQGRGPDRQVRYGRIVGLVFCFIGFVVIGFGWNGMAKVACPDCQLPYLLSAGATGIGLIIVGIGLLIASQIRDERMKLGEQLREVGATVGKSVAATAGPAGTEQVVVGKSTYHRPTCRLVEGKAEVELVSVDVARLRRLSPCRVCDPPVEKASSAAGDGAAASPQPPGDAGPPAGGDAGATQTTEATGEATADGGGTTSGTTRKKSTAKRSTTRKKSAAR